jgi:hypothetical protein
MFAAKDLFFDSNSGLYQISRSVRFRSSASGYFSRTPAAAGNRRTWTWSGWVKRGTLNTQMRIISCSNNNALQTLLTYNVTTDAMGFQFANASVFTTTQVFRDPSAWYHIVLAVDTTQATNTNRVKLYINGSQVTALTVGAYPTQNAVSDFNNNLLQTISSFNGTSEFFNGYMTEINFIDGQALTPSSFGTNDATTGVWEPIRYAGTYGTNGYYLNFSDNSAATAAAIGKDSSGNGNNWTPSGISVTAGATYDSMVDVPTLSGSDSGAGGQVRGNYCVMNPVAKNSRVTIANANLQVTGDNTANHQIVYGTFPITTGKWYWEVVVNNATTSTVNIVGIQSYVGFADGTYCGVSGNGIGWGYTTTLGNFYSSNFTVSGSAPVLANGTIGIAYDADAGKIWFRNTSGSWVQGDPAAGTSPTGTLSGTATTMMPAVSFYNSNGAWSFNFGQQAFSYTAPSGYQALCTQNFPTPTIANGASYMAATLYTGNGTTQTITNTVGTASFQPDLVWQKNRSSAANNILLDSVRGGSLYLITNSTSADLSAPGYMTFNSNGATFSSSDIATNQSGQTYVAWQWQAGKGTTSSNTSGSITSTVSAGATQGFSVVSYTGNGTAGATVGHGLGVAPSMIIVKERSPDTNYNWFVYHTSVGNTAYLLLNTTNASSSGVSAWNNTTPTSSVFTVGSYTEVNKNTAPFIAYAFAPIAGYSAFGSYTGNGSSDGTFVYLGFRPRFVMFKRTDTTGSWFMEDSSRGTYNVMGPELYAESTAAEGTSNRLDFLSNGFKMRAANAGDNASGGTYVYACFAENPFKYALAR